MTRRPFPQQADVALFDCTLLLHLPRISRPLGPHDLSMTKGRALLFWGSSQPSIPSPYQLAPSAHSQSDRIVELKGISEARKPYLGQDRACLAQSRAGLAQVIQQSRPQPRSLSTTPRQGQLCLSEWPEFVWLNPLGLAGRLLNSHYGYRSHAHALAPATAHSPGETFGRATNSSPQSWS